MSDRLPIVAVKMNQLDISLLQIETLFKRIADLEAAFVKHGMCPNCFGYLCDCECEENHG